MRVERQEGPEARVEGEREEGERRERGGSGFVRDILYIPSYTFIYLQIPPNSSKYFYLHSFTPHILQDIQY